MSEASLYHVLEKRLRNAMSMCKPITAKQLLRDREIHELTGDDPKRLVYHLKQLYQRHLAVKKHNIAFGDWLERDGYMWNAKYHDLTIPPHITRLRGDKWPGTSGRLTSKQRERVAESRKSVTVEEIAAAIGETIEAPKPEEKRSLEELAQAFTVETLEPAAEPTPDSKQQPKTRGAKIRIGGVTIIDAGIDDAGLRNIEVTWD